MARRMNYVPAAKKEPLSRWMGQLEYAVGELRDRVVDRERLELTKQEMLDLLVPQEYHEALREASRIVRHSYYLDHEYRVQWNGKTAIKFTCDRLLAVDSDFVVVRRDNFIAHRVDTWLDRRLELGREFGRVLWLVRKLNEHCNTLGHVRYYWPAILTLCSTRNNLQELADKLCSASGANAPPLPTYVRTVCGLAAGTVTAASLLDAGDIPDNREVKVDLVGQHSHVLIPDEHAGSVPLL